LTRKSAAEQVRECEERRLADIERLAQHVEEVQNACAERVAMAEERCRYVQQVSEKYVQNMEILSWEPIAKAQSHAEAVQSAARAWIERARELGTARVHQAKTVEKIAEERMMRTNANVVRRVFEAAAAPTVSAKLEKLTAAQRPDPLTDEAEPDTLLEPSAEALAP
jgi:hypothetical protein